jgi:hypothetical protein
MKKNFIQHKNNEYVIWPWTSSTWLSQQFATELCHYLLWMKPKKHREVTMHGKSMILVSFFVRG